MAIRALMTLVVMGLVGCASAPDTERASGTVTCAAGEPATGSQIVRRDRCIEVSDETRAEARRKLEEMQEAQRRSRPTKGPGGG